MSDRPCPSPTSDSGAANVYVVPRQRTVIEQNGSEYLVTINGAVFLALSLAQAEAMARRVVRARPRNGTRGRSRLASAAAAVQGRRAVTDRSKSDHGEASPGFARRGAQ
jgi:hypothetical protein